MEKQFQITDKSPNGTSLQGYFPASFEDIKKLLGEPNSPSGAHVGYNISPLSRVKLKILITRLTACC